MDFARMLAYVISGQILISQQQFLVHGPRASAVPSTGLSGSASLINFEHSSALAGQQHGELVGPAMGQRRPSAICLSSAKLLFARWNLFCIHPLQYRVRP